MAMQDGVDVAALDAELIAQLSAIGQMLTSAVGVAMSPVPLIAIVLMLATGTGQPRPRD